MKIGIIGAPGSGKTDLAVGIKDALTGKCDFDIVDDYVPVLSAATGNAYGHFADYIGNFQVAFERLTTEQRVSGTADQTDTITCGTVVDSLIYAAMYSQLAVRTPRDQRAEFARVSTAMSMFGMLVHDTLDYDLLFYLPLTPLHRYEHEGEWNTLLDLEYAPTFVSIDIVPILLDDGDVNNLAKAVQNIFELINREEENAPTDE